MWDFATAKETLDEVETTEGEGGRFYQMVSRSVMLWSGDARAGSSGDFRLKDVPWALSAGFPPMVFG